MKTESGWDDATKEAVYCNAANRPNTWFVKGCHLKTAADRCDWIDATGNPNKNHVAYVYTMLIAMAIEALLKAALVLRIGSPLVPGKRGRSKLNNEFKTHDLRALARRLKPHGFPISDPDLELLDRLTLFVLWFGRYPIPTDSHSVEQVGTSSPERARILEFYQRLHNYLIGFEPKLNDLV